jgi:hypothetical protein
VDLTRLSAAFANDVAALARQILHVSAEMREGLVPFRLEAGPGGDLGQFGPGQFGAPAQPSWPMGQMGQFGPPSGPRQPPLLDSSPDRGAYRPRWDAPPPPAWG